MDYRFEQNGRSDRDNAALAMNIALQLADEYGLGRRVIVRDLGNDKFSVSVHDSHGQGEASVTATPVTRG